MPCEPADHLFWPGTHREVAELAARPGSKDAQRHHWPCAVCKTQVDLLTEAIHQDPQARPDDR